MGQRDLIAVSVTLQEVLPRLQGLGGVVTSGVRIVGIVLAAWLRWASARRA